MSINSHKVARYQRGNIGIFEDIIPQPFHANHVSFMDTITHMTRVLLLLSVLTFPFLLPLLVFSLRSKDKDTGIPNEELWERDRTNNPGMTQSDFHSAPAWHSYSFIRIVDHDSIEMIPPILAAGIWTATTEERSISRTNRVNVAILLTQDLFLYSIEMD